MSTKTPTTDPKIIIKNYFLGIQSAIAKRCLTLPSDGEDQSDDASPNGEQAMAAQLNNIRLKLEEKRRRIEQDKRRMEVAVSRQRQQLGQQAFLQAVTRVS